MAIRAGVIGCGRIAWQWDRPGSRTYNTHAKAYAAHPGVRLVACADPLFSNAKALAARYRGVNPYRDYHEMLRKESLDVVSVCTPLKTHYDVVGFLLTHTPVRCIFAEKPLTTTIEHTRVLAALARKRQAHIAINYYRRFDRTLGQVRDLITGCSLGTLRFGRAVYYGGIKANAIHLIDLLDFFGFQVSDPRRIGSLKQTGDDWQGSFLVHTSGKAPIVFQWFDKEHYGYLEVDLFFERGRVRIGDYSDAKIFHVFPSRDYPGYRDLKLVKTLPSTVNTVMKYAVDNLVRHVRERKVDYRFITREMRLMKFIQRIIP